MSSLVRKSNSVPFEIFIKNPKTNFHLDNLGGWKDDEFNYYNVINNKIVEGRNQHKRVLGVVYKNKNKNIIILNADEGESYCLVDDCKSYQFPVLSFACLSKFFNNKKHNTTININNIADLLIKGTFNLLDYSADEWKDVEHEDLILYNNWKKRGEKGKCPITIPRGFSVVGKQYHKASGVLLKDNRKNGKTMVFGVDEDQYFGCELPTNPRTLKQAFIDLIPKEIRDKKYERQGEWFCVEISKKDFPKRHEFDMFQTDFYNEKTICLPIDDPDSNVHILRAKLIGIKDKVIYIQNGNISHDQHETLILDKYHYFVKNTALRSVSQEGVD